MEGGQDGVMLAGETRKMLDRMELYLEKMKVWMISAG